MMGGSTKAKASVIHPNPWDGNSYQRKPPVQYKRTHSLSPLPSEYESRQQHEPKEVYGCQGQEEVKSDAQQAAHQQHEEKKDCAASYQNCNYGSISSQHHHSNDTIGRSRINEKLGARDATRIGSTTAATENSPSLPSSSLSSSSPSSILGECHTHHQCLDRKTQSKTERNWRKEVKAFHEFTKQQQRNGERIALSIGERGCHRRAHRNDNFAVEESSFSGEASGVDDPSTSTPVEWVGRRRVIFPVYWVKKQSELGMKGLLLDDRNNNEREQHTVSQVTAVVADASQNSREKTDVTEHARHQEGRGVDIMKEAQKNGDIQEVPRSSAIEDVVSRPSSSKTTEEGCVTTAATTRTDDSSTVTVCLRSILRKSASPPPPLSGQIKPLDRESPSSFALVRSVPSLPVKVSDDESEKSRVSFDPNIRVLEFRREQTETSPESRWFTDQEIAKFKREAISEVYARVHQHIPKFRGSIGTRGGKPFLDDLGFSNGSNEFHEVLLREIHSLLIVAPDKCILILMAKYVTNIMPHVLVQTALSAEQALKRIEGARVTADESSAYHGYDIILVEEKIGRLDEKDPLSTKKSMSPRRENPPGDSSRGTNGRKPKLLKRLSSEQETSTFSPTRNSLLIGLSSTLSGLHYDMMRKNGADLVWGVPPPKVNSSMRDELLNAVLEKRGKDALTSS